jgi:hypothetical protein
MSARILSTTGILTAATALILIRSAAVDVQAQTPADGRVATAAASSWVPPRTPWGDPDIQGIFTNKYEQGTPLERPVEFEGRRLEDISGEELTKIVQERQRVSIERAPFAGGDPEGRLGGPLHWGTALRSRKEAAPGSSLIHLTAKFLH